MMSEDRLRQLLSAEVDTYQPRDDSMRRVRQRVEARRRARLVRRIAVAAVAAAAAAIVVPLLALSHQPLAGRVHTIAPASRGSSASSTTPRIQITPNVSTTTTPPTTSPPTTSPPTASPPTTALVAPGAVVQEYYDAINSRDYQKAWALGGENLNSNYAAYVQGLSGTSSDIVTILSTQGNTVAVGIVVTEDSGVKVTYQGTYTVSNGVIVSANLQGGACQLTLTTGQGMGAAGHYVRVLIFTNIGQATCTVFGYADLHFFDANGQPIPATVNHGGSFTFPAVAPESFSLAPGQQAAFDIGGLDSIPSTGGDCPEASVVDVYTPPVTPPALWDVSVTVSVPVCPSGTDESPVVAGSEGPHF